MNSAQDTLAGGLPHSMLPPRSQLASSQLSISKTPFGRPSFEVRFFRTAKPSFPAAFSPGHLVVDGGGERARTVDLLLAKQALSQLSYTPVRNPERRNQNSNFCRSPVLQSCRSET